MDTNIVLDVLQNREPWASDGQKIFLAIANKQITGCLTAKEVNDIAYFSHIQFKGQDFIDQKVRGILTNLYAVFELIDTLADDCHDALALPNDDYEDAVMIKSAIRADVDCIVTRDKDYVGCPIPVYKPNEFVNLLNSNSASGDNRHG